MKKLILLLTIALTLAGTLLIPAPSVYAASSDAPLADLVTTNDNNQIIQYAGAGWSHTTELAGYISEDRHASAVMNDYAQFTFYGVSVSLISALDADQGKADIYIDTVFQETIDLYSASLTLQSAIYAKTGLSSTTHTIKVVVKGEKNNSSNGYVVNLDAFRVVDQPPAPPGGNEIECWTPGQYDPGYVCTQVNTQHVTIVGTNVDTGHYDPAWRLLSGGVGTVYARLVGISVHWWSGPFSGSGINEFRFDVKGEYCGGRSCGSDQQTRNIGSYWPSGNVTLSVAAFQGQEVVSSAGYYTTAAQTWPSGPAAGYTNRHTFVLDVQTVPFANSCVDNYTALVTGGPFIIDPTIEFPEGPEGDPADEQTYPVVPGYSYMVRLGGDGWHDGTASDQFGGSYSWDNVTWYDLGAATCVTLTESYYRSTSVIDVPAGVETVYFRAKDDPGDFATNYMDSNEHFIYTIALVIFTGELTCDSQFTYDPGEDWVASAEVPADEPYVAAIDDPGEGPLIPGEWYVIQIAFGSWQDGGDPPDRYDADYSWGNVMTHGPEGAVWSNIDTDGTNVYCETEDGDYATIYTQADDSEALYFRVNDLAGTFDDNTGALFIDVYHASFDRRPANCELTYATEGFIGHSEIPANAKNGITIGISASINQASLFGSMRMVPGAWYMLETIDGPWGWLGATHSDMSYDVAVLWGGDWVPLENWTEGICNIALDSLGHRRVYFQAPVAGGAEYTFRVADSEVWFNNVSGVGIDLYGAYDQEVSLPDGTCDYIYDADHPVNGPAPIIVQGTEKDGEYIGNILTAGNIYAFKFEGSDYYWTESGGEHLYAMQISDDNGTSWHDAPTGYGPVLCYIENGNDTIMFIKAGAQYLYRFRVDSESFSNNTGSMGINIYPANAGDTIDPWTSCIEGLTKYVIDPHEWIDVRAEDGQDVWINDSYTVDEDVLGFVVEIEFGTGPWDDGETETQHYDAALSSDNGDTWYPLDHTNPDLICAKLDQLGHYATAYFSKEIDQKWKIRVNDADTDTFTDNTGNLAYVLYAVTEISTVPDCLVDTNNYNCIPSTVAFTINGNDVCTSSAIRPQPPTGIDVPAWLAYVGGWIGYGTHVMLQFMAWCPRHTDALMGLLNLFKTKDPIALMTELADVVTRVKTELNAYNWGDTGAEATILTTSATGGAAANSIMGRLFPSTSVWNGGPLITGLQTWTGNSYFSACVANYSEIVDNEGLTGGLCFVSSAAKLVGAMFVLQIMLELAAIGFLLRDLIRQAQNLAEFMAGNRSE